jgi:hypothetical protein
MNISNVFNLFSLIKNNKNLYIQVRSFLCLLDIEKIYRLQADTTANIVIKSRNLILQEKMYSFNTNEFNKLIYIEQIFKKSKFHKSDTPCYINDIENSRKWKKDR